MTSEITSNMVMLCGYKGLDAGYALPSRATPNLTCPPSSQETKRILRWTPAVFQTDRVGGDALTAHPLPSLLEVRPHLSHPDFFPLTIPPSLSGWLVFSAYSPTKETKEAGLLSLSPPHSPTPRREEGCRPAGPPFLKMQTASAAKSADVQNS